MQLNGLKILSYIALLGNSLLYQELSITRIIDQESGDNSFKQKSYYFWLYYQIIFHLSCKINEAIHSAVCSTKQKGKSISHEYPQIIVSIVITVKGIDVLNTGILVFNCSYCHVVAPYSPLVSHRRLSFILTPLGKEVVFVYCLLQEPIL